MEIDKKRIDNFLSNRCSSKECSEISDYFEKNEPELDHLPMFEDIGPDEMIYSSSSAKKRAYYRLPFVQHRVRLLYIKAVAAAVVLCVFSFLLWDIVDRNHSNDIDIPNYTITNDGKTYKRVTLPDGSTLLLWPKAGISYNADFSEDRLINQLGGKVKYTITPNKLSPFRTVYENIETKVLGTVFTIGEHNDGRLSIRLEEGKIQVQDVERRIEPIVLDPPADILIDKHTLVYEISTPHTSDFKTIWKEERKNAHHAVRQGISEWTNDHILLKGINNTDLIDLVERLYGVQIIVKNKQALAGNFTGSVLYHENLDILLRSFCEMNDCTYRWDSGIIYLE